MNCCGNQPNPDEPKEASRNTIGITPWVALLAGAILLAGVWIVFLR
ncbi:MAG: hypothetical protein HY917_03375 [Candidatus Diapherotrites archaeon]|nr:hypothetical protein [Candidatus Diapherotrites archaeon]